MSGPRYSIVPARAIDDPRVGDVELRVLNILGTYTNQNGWCQVNQRKVAERCGKSRETINRAISSLTKQGYLRKEARFSATRGQSISRYQVVLDQEFVPDADEPPVTVGSHPPVTVGSHPPVTPEDHTPCDPQGSHLNDPSLQRTTPQPSLSDLTATFRSVVEIWPRFEESHREKAWGLFVALTPLEQAQLLSAARRYPQEVKDEAARQGRTLDQHRRFTKSLPRWIAERRWLGSEVMRSTEGTVSVKRNDPIFEACAEIEGSKAALNAGSWSFKAATVDQVKARVKA